jgi:hypothetical protein
MALENGNAHFDPKNNVVSLPVFPLGWLLYLDMQLIQMSPTGSNERKWALIKVLPFIFLLKAPFDNGMSTAREKRTLENRKG